TRILTISAKGEVDIGRITFQNGNPSQYAGGALNLTNNSTAPTYIFSSIFINNTDSNTSSATYVTSVGDVYFLSNLLIANSRPTTLAFYDPGNTYINGNTILANSGINHVAFGALNPQGSGHYYVSNNILWNNEVADVYDGSGVVDYAYNDVGVISN